MSSSVSPTGADGAAAPAAGSTTLYFTLAIALTWVSLTPPSLAALGFLPGAPDQYMQAAPIAVLAPTIAAIVAARREGGGAAVRAMLRGLRAWRVSPVWYVLALTLPGLTYAVGRAAYGLVGSDGGPYVYPPVRPEHIAGMIIVPIGEEIGWRGFAMPRLTARHGALRATAYLGALWGLWHLPMFLSSRFSAVQVVGMTAYIVFGNVGFSWFWRRTGGSLLLAVLFHVGAHLDAPTHGGIPERMVPMYILLGANIALAIALLALDRRAFEGTSVGVPGAGAAAPS